MHILSYHIIGAQTIADRLSNFYNDILYYNIIKYCIIIIHVCMCMYIYIYIHCMLLCYIIL